MIRLFLLVGVICSSFILCSPAGTIENYQTMDDNLLPAELKGLKVYNVSLGGGNAMRIAVVTNSAGTTATYSDGKTSSATLKTADSFSPREIPVKEIIMENDSMIVARK